MGTVEKKELFYGMSKLIQRKYPNNEIKQQQCMLKFNEKGSSKDKNAVVSYKLILKI